MSLNIGRYDSHAKTLPFESLLVGIARAAIIDNKPVPALQIKGIGIIKQDSTYIYILYWLIQQTTRKVMNTQCQGRSKVE